MTSFIMLREHARADMGACEGRYGFTCGGRYGFGIKHLPLISNILMLCHFQIMIFDGLFHR